MGLVDKFTDKLLIEQKIESLNGELPKALEEDYDEICNEISTNIDRVVYRLESSKSRIDLAKTYVDAARANLSSLKKQDKNLKDFLTNVVKENGKLKTEFSSLYTCETTHTRVVVQDFDMAMESHPECVVVKTSDNIRTITLEKSALKQIDEKERKGFVVEESKSESLRHSIKGKNIIRKE